MGEMVDVDTGAGGLRLDGTVRTILLDTVLVVVGGSAAWKNGLSVAETGLSLLLGGAGFLSLTTGLKRRLGNPVGASLTSSSLSS